MGLCMVEPEWFAETYERVGQTTIVSMNYDMNFFKNWSGHYLANIDYRAGYVYYLFKPNRAITNSQLTMKVKHENKSYRFNTEVALRIIPELFTEFIV